MTNTFQNKIIFAFFILIGFFTGTNVYAQYPWPVEPMHQSQYLTGTFCEFRDTGSSDHFHNAVDIPKADGSPVYAIANGNVTSISSTGTYVRVERYCYLHIVPNPSFDVGDAVVAEQTVMGTIQPGQGHIHFIDGYPNDEINAIRSGGGLTPYEDPWPPIIRFVKFFVDGTEQEFTTGKVTGKVDIVVKVEEQNGPPSSATSRLNNGTYEIGYKILSANRDSVVFTPPNLGVRFRFMNKPNNQYVHNVFFKKYSSTSSHTYTVTNDIRANSYWDTSQYPPENYTIMVFTKDTRQNTDTVYVSVEVHEEDFLPPEPPILKYVKQVNNGFQIAWYPNNEADLMGYRLHYSYDNSDWKLRYDEYQVPVDSTTATFSTTISNDIYFKLEAVDNAPIPNVSQGSDVYGLKLDEIKPMVLVVDGFDRNDAAGAWQQPSHAFAYTYGQAISENGFSFDCCSNDAVIDSIINLNDYFAVVWFLGDEGEKDVTFTQEEQNLVRSFLSDHGRLFISGLNVAWNLDLDSDCYSATSDDNEFLNNVVKADFAKKIPAPGLILGSPNSLFAGIEFSLNPQIYRVDSIDTVLPLVPATSTLTDTAYLNTFGIAWDYESGSFENAKLVYFTFPFELIESTSAQTDVMLRVLSFFFVMDAVDEHQDNEINALPKTLLLDQNYPNPFNSSTKIKFYIPTQGNVNVQIFNIAGHKIQTLMDRVLPSGFFQIEWDARNEAGEKLASGIYFLRLEVDGNRQVRKMMLLN